MEVVAPTAENDDYMSTNGVGVDTEAMVIDKTANTPPSEGAEEAEIRARKTLAEERERITYWVVEEEEISAEPAVLGEHLKDMEGNFFRIDADLQNVETGTYNPKGRLSREAQGEIKAARAKVTQAKNYVASARARFDAQNYEGAAERLEGANNFLTEAQEIYIDALEIETGVTETEEVDQ